MGANAIVRGRVSDVEMVTPMPLIYKTLNWLRVFGNAEASRMESREMLGKSQNSSRMACAIHQKAPRGPGIHAGDG